MRRRRLRSSAIRYSGPVKVIETTGPWGVYTGERIVLGDGRALDDDLGLRIRKAFEPDAAQALERSERLGDSFELRNLDHHPAAPPLTHQTSPSRQSPSNARSSRERSR